MCGFYFYTFKSLALSSFIVIINFKYIGENWIKRDSRTKRNMSLEDPISVATMFTTTETWSRPSLHHS